MACFCVSIVLDLDCFMNPYLDQILNYLLSVNFMPVLNSPKKKEVDGLVCSVNGK